MQNIVNFFISIHISPTTSISHSETLVFKTSQLCPVHFLCSWYSRLQLSQRTLIIFLLLLFLGVQFLIFFVQLSFPGSFSVLTSQLSQQKAGTFEYISQYTGNKQICSVVLKFQC